MNLEFLKSYVQSSSYLMETLDDFNKKLEILHDLWPQVKDGKVEYLIGKGIAVELALRGEISRSSRCFDCSYRRHGDLELYGVNSEQLKSDEFKNFHYVFGGQEVSDVMKSLKDIKPDLLFSTCEEVLYNEKKYYIPELELLFLDKFLRVEDPFRNEGPDYLLLLKKYDLSLDKILKYFDEYYLNPIISAFDEGYSNLAKEQIEGLISLANIALSECASNGDDFDLKDINKYVNNRIKSMKEENISFFGIKGNLVEYDPPIKYDNDVFVLDDQDYLQKINLNVENLKYKDEKVFYDKKTEIINMFNERKF